jgi:hypothetical protein
MTLKYLMGLTFCSVFIKETSFFQLADLDAQILVNHSKLDELHERIERIRFPVQQKLEEEKEKQNINVANEELCH